MEKKRKGSEEESKRRNKRVIEKDGKEVKEIIQKEESEAGRGKEI